LFLKNQGSVQTEQTPLRHLPTIDLSLVLMKHHISACLSQEGEATDGKMINAVLVFNNNGQPRLTKFYTQLVGSSGGYRSAPDLR
jgi:hypothetical protein